MKILIVGLPKTGTTALLFLIAKSLGKQPVILFEPKVCPAGLESNNGDVIAKVLLNPDVDATSFAHFDKKITIVRDPRDFIVSALLYSQYHANYLKDDDRVRIMRECLVRKESDPAGVSIREILDVMGKVSTNPDRAARHRESMRTTLARFDKYVATVADGFLYRYEDFVSRKYEPLAQCLGIPISGTALVPDELKRVERTKGHGDWRNWFTPEDVRDYQPILAGWLKKYGYDAEDWALNPTPSIAPKHCSEYFMRLVREIRENPLETSHVTNSIGHLDTVNELVCGGWAFYPEQSGEAAKVRILVNGRLVRVVEARQPRADVKKQGIHPTGLCGFRFQWAAGTAPRPGDKVEAWAEGDAKALGGSPRFVDPEKTA